MSGRDQASLGTAPPAFDAETAAGGAPPTFAAFSPVTLSANTPSRPSRRSTVLVHQKSPLLLATPPQITRALAYSHPFLLPLNALAGLLTWSTGDPWQSFLLLCLFWAVALYGDVVVRWAGPVVGGAALITGMYGRRYSPLSTSAWNEPAIDARNKSPRKPQTSGAASPSKAGRAASANQRKGHERNNSEATSTKHRKTLDEIVETLKELTGRCNVLLEPLLDLTDFLSTQRTPTRATTKPALTALFVRLVVITPFWIALAMPPWRIITTRRVVLVAGSLFLTWHARFMRVTRALLWRSSTVRRLAEFLTGLHFEGATRLATTKPQSSSEDSAVQFESELTKALHRRSSSFHVSPHRPRGEDTAGVKFTFIIYENQRRWVGLGWTASLFAYERPAWTDEHLNAVPPKDEFELPEVEDGTKTRWRWAPGSQWRVDGVADEQGAVDYDGEEGKNGWIYYDNRVGALRVFCTGRASCELRRDGLTNTKWQNGRRGQDGWGRWTRRRKWYRDAELVEIDETAAPRDNARDVHLAGTVDSYSTVDEKMISPSGTGSWSRKPVSSRAVKESTGDSDSVNDDVGTKEDSASMHSTSSKSFFRPSSLRRRITDKSSITDRDYGRRMSDVGEDDTSGLGIELGLQLQKQGKEGGEWGIGDEARMSLE